LASADAGADGFGAGGVTPAAGGGDGFAEFASDVAVAFGAGALSLSAGGAGVESLPGGAPPPAGPEGSDFAAAGAPLVCGAGGGEQPGVARQAVNATRTTAKSDRGAPASMTFLLRSR